MKRSRALLSVMPIALAASLLVSCSSGDGESDGQNGDGATAIQCAAEGNVSKSIEIEGDFGSDSITLASELPVSVEGLERSVLIDGEGDEISQGKLVGTQFTIFNGTTGEVFSTSQDDLEIDEGMLAPWAIEVIGCGQVGDRIAAATPATEVVDESMLESFGLEATDSLVIVFDVLSVGEPVAEPGTLEPDELLSKAEGVAQEVGPELPSVVLDADGAPTITMPEGVDAPTELTVVTLIEGDGEEVQAGDRVYVHYRGVIWRTGEEFDSSWSRGEPIAFTTDGVIGGFAEALVGQKVGSQVMSIVPAEDGGYGGSQLVSMGHEADDVMVFVLDILGTTHAG